MQRLQISHRVGNLQNMILDIKKNTYKCYMPLGFLFI